MTKDTQTNENEVVEEANEERREALRKLGRYAYTAPVMLSLLVSNKASADSFIDGGGPPGGP